MFRGSNTIIYMVILLLRDRIFKIQSVLHLLDLNLLVYDHSVSFEICFANLKRISNLKITSLLLHFHFNGYRAAVLQPAVKAGLQCNRLNSSNVSAPQQ